MDWPAAARTLTAGLDDRAVRPNPWKSIVGGFAGTTAMTVIMYALAPLVVSEPPNFASILDGIDFWVPALLLHVINGSITLPLIYAYLVFRFLPGEPWLKGVLWGLILWGLAELIVMPLMGAGLFRTDAGVMPIVAALVVLLAHLAYGALLGWLAGDGTEPSEGPPAIQRLAA
jgi:uncharacterized protein DUF6789